MKNFIQFFQEENGQLSGQRLIFIIGSIYAMLMGAWVFYSTHDYMGVAMLVGVLSATFGTQKLVQKSQETKPIDPNLPQNQELKK